MVLNNTAIKNLLRAFKKANPSAIQKIPYYIFKALWDATKVAIKLDIAFNLEIDVDGHVLLDDTETKFPKDEFISFYLQYYQEEKNMNDTSSDTVTNPAFADINSQINNTTNSSINYTDTTASYINTGINFSTAIPALIDHTTFTKCNEKTSTEKQNTMFNFDFGPVGVNEVRMSMNGLAVKNAEGIWVAYDGENINNVDILNFECEDFVYKLPVGQNSLNPGDIIYHNKRYLWIKSIEYDHLTVVDPCSSDIRDIILTKSPFGFSFCVKVVNLMDGFGGCAQASADNPFGNMWMFALMKDKDKNKDILPILMMMNGGNTEMNPMLMYALMK